MSRAMTREEQAEIQRALAYASGKSPYDRYMPFNQREELQGLRQAIIIALWHSAGSDLKAGKDALMAFWEKTGVPPMGGIEDLLHVTQSCGGPSDRCPHTPRQRPAARPAAAAHV